MDATNSYKEALDLMSKNQKILKNVKHPALKKRLRKIISDNLDTLHSNRLDYILEQAEVLKSESKFEEAIKKLRHQQLLKKINNPKTRKGYIDRVNTKLKELKISKIRMSILNLGTKFARLQVKEIAEKTGEKSDLIIDTVKKMVANEDIYAEYFASSQAVAFDQQANIDEIDDLMNQYKDWESKGEGKKS